VERGVVGIGIGVKGDFLQLMKLLEKGNGDNLVKGTQFYGFELGVLKFLVELLVDGLIQSAEDSKGRGRLDGRLEMLEFRGGSEPLDAGASVLHIRVITRYLHTLKPTEGFNDFSRVSGVGKRGNIIVSDIEGVETL